MKTGSILLACILWAGLAAASEKKPMLGGGGEIPSPFEYANLKVELADGETYLLVGKVVLQPVNSVSAASPNYKAFFEVDLNEHPWLATTRRKLNPFYPLEGPWTYWKQFRGMKIRLACQAHGIALANAGKLDYTISLKRLNDDPVEPFQDER